MTSLPVPDVPVPGVNPDAMLAMMQAQGGEFQLQGHGPLEFSLHLPSPCQVRAHQRALAPQSSPTPTRTDIRHYRLNDVTARIQIHCPAR